MERPTKPEDMRVLRLPTYQRFALQAAEEKIKEARIMARTVLHEILEEHGMSKSAMVLGRNDQGDLLLPSEEWLAKLGESGEAPEESGGEDGPESLDSGDE